MAVFRRRTDTGAVPWHEDPLEKDAAATVLQTVVAAPQAEVVLRAAAVAVQAGVAVVQMAVEARQLEAVVQESRVAVQMATLLSR